MHFKGTFSFFFPIALRKILKPDSLAVQENKHLKGWHHSYLYCPQPWMVGSFLPPSFIIKALIEEKKFQK